MVPEFRGRKLRMEHICDRSDLIYRVNSLHCLRDVGGNNGYDVPPAYIVKAQ